MFPITSNDLSGEILNGMMGWYAHWDPQRNPNPWYLKAYKYFFYTPEDYEKDAWIERISTALGKAAAETREKLLIETIQEAYNVQGQDKD